MVLLLAIGVVGLAAAIFLFALTWRYPAPVALVALAAGIALDCLQTGVTGFNLGVTVYPDDFVCVFMFTAGVISAVKNRQISLRTSWPMYILFALGLCNLIRGSVAFGIKPAGNGARNLMYMVLPCLGVSLLTSVRFLPERVAKWLIYGGLSLVAIALLRWAGVVSLPVGISADDFREVSRVLPSDFAMLIGQGLIALVFVQLARGVTTTRTVLTVLVGATLLALQHRSVWTATAAGLLWMATRTFRVSSRTWFGFVGAGLLSGLVALVILYMTGRTQGIISMVTSNFEETQQSTSTWTWRVQGFEEATRRVFTSGLTEMLIGPPSGRELGSNASFASIHIHNRYVDTLAYFGLVGAVTLLLWLTALNKRINGWMRGRQANVVTILSRVFLQALFLSQLVYLIAYFGGISQGGLMALLWIATAPALAAASKTDGRLIYRPAYQRKYRRDSRRAPAFPALGRR